MNEPIKHAYRSQVPSFRLGCHIACQTLRAKRQKEGSQNQTHHCQMRNIVFADRTFRLDSLMISHDHFGARAFFGWMKGTSRRAARGEGDSAYRAMPRRLTGKEKSDAVLKARRASLLCFLWTCTSENLFLRSRKQVGGLKDSTTTTEAKKSPKRKLLIF